MQIIIITRLQRVDLMNQLKPRKTNNTAMRLVKIRVLSHRHLKLTKKKTCIHITQIWAENQIYKLHKH